MPQTKSSPQITSGGKPVKPAAVASPDPQIVNIAAYKFVDLAETELPALKNRLKQVCISQHLKGTILLSTEGINLCLSGEAPAIDAFWQTLTCVDSFSDMHYKVSRSAARPFRRLVIKIRKEIIAIGQADIQPAKFTGPRITPRELKRWLDEGRDLLLLDTRNDYEFSIGTFDGATHLDIAAFRDFPDAVGRLDPARQHKPVVMFCTGGIRCEKAAPVMLNKGFQEVYQLDGGILKYFEEVGGEHFTGECFVFDDRVAVDPSLAETGAVLCENCQMPVTHEQQTGPKYKTGLYCPFCIGNSRQ